MDSLRKNVAGDRVKIRKIPRQEVCFFLLKYEFINRSAKKETHPH